MENLNKLAYAKWLEETLRDIIDLPVESIYIMTKLDGGAITHAHYNCSVNDKILFAGNLQQEAMIDTLCINGMIPGYGPADDAEEEEE